MAVKSITFEWDGVSHTIEKVRFAKAEEFFSLLEQLGAGEGAKGIQSARALLVLMNCPQAVIDELAMDEIAGLLANLQRAHFGLKDKEDAGGAGPPDVAGNP